MIICKICNSEILGNGYCSQHSTGGTEYKIDKPNIKLKNMKYSIWCFLFGHKWRICIKNDEDWGGNIDTYQASNVCKKCGLIEDDDL